MQTPSASSAPAPAPAAPAPPPAPVAVTAIQEGAQGGASTLGTTAISAEQAALLRARREELREQMRSVERRRDDLARELQSSDAGARPGLEQRIAMLDEQTLQLERDMAVTNRQLLEAPPPPTIPRTEPPRVFGGFTSEEATAMGIVFTLFVLAPIALAYARLLWKRATRVAREPVVLESPHSAQRLERVEQAVDAIAIEVERVAEGQRFVTRLLSEGRPAMPAGVAREREPVLVEEPHRRPG